MSQLLPRRVSPRSIPISPIHRFAFASVLLTGSMGLLPRVSADDLNVSAGGKYPTAYAIKDVRIQISPGKTIEAGTIVVRSGIIEAVGPGKDVEVPYDAEVIEEKGLVVYPGFIDLYTTNGQRQNLERSSTGRGRPIDQAEAALASTPVDNRRGMTPEFDVAASLDLNESFAEPRRRLGFTTFLSAPSGAIATGQSALATLSGLPRREAVLKTPVALHIHPTVPTEPQPQSSSPGVPPSGPRRRADREGPEENPYPRSLMGSVAHLRQAMIDSEYHHLVRARSDAGRERASYDPSLDALWSARERKLPVWWQADSRDEIHRSLDLAAEFGTSAVIVGGREASKTLDRLKRESVAVVLRINFPEEPKVPTEEEYRKRPPIEQDEPLALLEHRKERWKEQVATAAALEKAGIPFAFATDGIERLEDFHSHLRTLLTAGLTEDQLLSALTLQAAKIVDVDRRLGTLEVGKLGQVVAFSGPIRDEKAKLRFVLVDGLKFEIKPPERGQDNGRRTGGERRGGTTRSPARPSSEVAEEPAESTPGGKVPKSNVPGPPRKPDGKPAETKSADRPRDEKPKAPETHKSEGTKLAPKPNEGEKVSPGLEKGKAAQPPFSNVVTEFDAQRAPRIKTGGNVLIRDATILTVTRGTIRRGSILVRKGKIAAVGTDLKPGADTAWIDATGLVAMPGIIDTHSHIAIQGSVNEISLSLVPEVRVKDVVTGDDIAIYRALAGGTTTARLLHGSANAIGGQDAVIKLRYGQAGHDLIIRDAPQGVKFALGENVTRMRGRFPNTRMGVEAVLEQSFVEARNYRRKWDMFSKSRGNDPVASGMPPRRDLRLDALAGVLDGSIRIHSHCYRSDEILMLLNVAERHGIRVRSLQHVLEGYKVAAEIAAHGASASTFSDWWGYKMEAYDAIPANAALLTRAGASVCIKSDSEELIRHLNLEAAKMVKYGGLTEDQALAMITFNPARELGLEGRLGSIEVGKDADIALFNGHPFDAFSRCQLTLIDGEVWFQRAEPDGRGGRREGDHGAMPQVPELARNRRIEIEPQPKGVYALIGADLHPVSRPVIPRGTLIVADGKIEAIGPSGSKIPPTAQSIDLSGLDVWPGLVDAGTNLGLYEVGSLMETQDFADAGRFQPELRASTALHPDSEHIPVTRANGILTAYVEPSGGLIAGQGCLIQLSGWVPRELLIADPVALHVNIPAYIARVPGEPRRPGLTPAPGMGGGAQGSDPQARRKEQIESIKEIFRRAGRYDKAAERARSSKSSMPQSDLHLEALRPYVRGERAVIFHAQLRAEILDALAIARELKLKAVVSGGLEAWKVAPALKHAGVPVIVAGTLSLPAQVHDPYDAAYANPSLLHRAGVTVAIKSTPGMGGSGPRNLPFEAATSSAFGLPDDIALRALTLTPAQILGVADRIGSLDVGKRADLVITAGHILQPTTSVLALFIGGKPLTPESRHTQLRAKFERRLEEVRSGLAPLGLSRPSAERAGTVGMPSRAGAPASIDGGPSSRSGERR